jgi:hypothetical protein
MAVRVFAERRKRSRDRMRAIGALRKIGEMDIA